ncbi:putative disease resistance protein RGA1 [Trifolium pratense]|uniref:putative disease resistance protein RGA1 n=1 Tax=Trifolium pratense TaxID=57577 RepID=UPI001E691BE4|nr:putative disease resistance protein RGA1 [Trifolium pratense]
MLEMGIGSSSSIQNRFVRMAEQIPYGVATTLINRLGSAALREYGRINGVMDELERLKNTVESIRAVLLNADDKQDQSHAVQNWVRRLKDVLIPADDLLDEFFIQDMIHKRDEPHQNNVTKVLHSLSPNIIAFRHKMAHEIGKIQKKFNDMVRDMSGLKLNPNVVMVGENNIEWRETGFYCLESDIIGREDDKRKIISLLRQPHEIQNVSLVAIVGIGGLGKTALAQLIYNDGEIKKCFEKSMWVCVSDNFDVKTIVKNMLESLSKNKIGDTLKLDTLQNILRHTLTGKRYLLVLDDVWNESFEKWDKLRTYLMCGAPGSKVVVTTRSTIVSQTMGVSIPYVLSSLTPKESWHLLKNIITYGDESKRVNQTIESIGKKIAEKCIGVPLAIRTLGGILQGKSEEREWIDVLQGDFWKLCEDEDSIMPVLKLSYQNLSPQLRQCFAYCSLYPKDWVINKDDLIQMWIAQSYLECSTVGNQFVNILFMKSFFQDATYDDIDGRIHSFKMHDLIHDIAMQVARNDCCYFDSGTKRLVGSPMHVMLESDAIGFLESVDASKLRTLILLSNNSESMNEKELFVILKFKHLRVLKLSNCSLSKLCNSFVKLKHLRYLSLYDCIGLGSKSISNLVCLQTLILARRHDLEISTKHVSMLINLKYFHISRKDVFEEKKTASGFRKLCMGDPYKGVSFSNWFSPLTNIVEIYIIRCSGVRYLPPMERLPFLNSIRMTYLDELEYIYYEEPLSSETFFPALEILFFGKCEKLRGWWRINDAVNDDDDNSSQSHKLSFPSFPPRLSFLTFIECPMLTRMPTFPNIGNRLDFNDSNMETLEGTLNMISSKCSIEFPPLSKLKQLFLKNVDLNVKKFPGNWVQNLTSLEHLYFENFPNQTFQEIETWFKEDFNYLPSLQKIEFSFCSDLKTLPGWILNLSSLQHITIEDCKNIASLPKGMSRLARLQSLEIVNCPLLMKECETQTSATWPKIAHIPNIILKRSSY